MGVIPTVLLATSRSELRERLVSLSLSSTGGQAWEHIPPFAGLDLLEIITSTDFFESSRAAEVDATATLRAKDSSGQIHLAYFGSIQNLFDRSLDLALLMIYAEAGKRGVSRLFSSECKPVFLRLLEKLEVVFGHESSIEALESLRREKGRREVLLSNRNLLIVGAPLVPYFGLERLRATHTFARWELPGPTFVFASPVYFYDLLDEEELARRGVRLRTTEDWPVLQTHPLAARELWDNPEHLTTDGALTEAIHRSWAALSDNLGIVGYGQGARVPLDAS